MDEIFAIWPTIAEMARDMGEPYPTVSSWVRRGIPAARDADVIAAAKRRGVDVTFERLHELRRGMRSHGRSAA